MTPKEKAKELFTKFSANTVHYDAAKQCALIAVDELIKATETVWFLDGNYWEKVKSEIEKL